jgi:hypothetical protein
MSKKDWLSGLGVSFNFLVALVYDTCFLMVPMSKTPEMD